MTTAPWISVADSIRGAMSIRELEWLHRVASSLPVGSSWVEIGFWEGRSGYAVAAGLPPGCTFYAVDNVSGPTTRESPSFRDYVSKIAEGLARMRVLNPSLTTRLILADSGDVHRLLHDGLFDVVFVDGDHAYKAVVRDIEGWRPKLKVGGLLCGHDHGNRCGVEPAVEELCPGFEIVPGTTIWHVQV